MRMHTHYSLLLLSGHLRDARKHEAPLRLRTPWSVFANTRTLSFISTVSYRIQEIIINIILLGNL